MDKRQKELLDFALKIKKLIRESGRTNVIPIIDLEELIIKYNIREEK